MNRFCILNFFTFLKLFLIAFLFVELTFSSPEVTNQKENASPNPKNSWESCTSQSNEKRPSINENTETAQVEPLKIVGGKKARPGQFPYQVLLEIQSLEGEFSICGGSIIHEEYILTAAHCLEDLAQPLYINITAGEISPVLFPWRGQRRRGVQIFVHEQYNQAGHRENDIGLIRIDEPFVFTNLVQPIALPTPFYFVAQGGTATASGWGQIKFGKHEPESDFLLYVDNLQILSDEVCQLFNIKYVIEDSMLCAFESSHDTCQGDSGGPLACYDENGVLIVCGVVSFGERCAVHGYPGIYTEVSYFISWIQRFVR